MVDGDGRAGAGAGGMSGGNECGGGGLSRVRKRASVVVLVMLVMQFVPLNRFGRAPERRRAPFPDHVRVLMRRSCDQCHSNRTVWGVAGLVAPVSWVVAGVVERGRGALNVSEWWNMEPERQRLAMATLYRVFRLHGEHWKLYYRLVPDARPEEAAMERAARWSLIGGE